MTLGIIDKVQGLCPTSGCYSQGGKQETVKYTKPEDGKRNDGYTMPKDGSSSFGYVGVVP